tara:strand:- start:1034 stop:1603 length:570 start_codon:yes stop_codon:yes gene_type:complete
MGMFDGIVCEYELPLPEDMGELSEINWNEFEFQTKSLDNTLDKYTIEDDGQIYKEETKQKWVDDEEHPNTGYIEIVQDGIEKSYFTGELIFYTWIPEEEYDYYIEFKTLFWKGELKEIERLSWDKKDNSQRKKEEQKFEELHEKFIKQIKEQSFFKKVFKKILYTITFCVRWILGFLVKLTWKLERWLT